MELRSTNIEESIAPGRHIMRLTCGEAPTAPTTHEQK
jgi:hypothetical protein